MAAIHEPATLMISGEIDFNVAALIWAPVNTSNTTRAQFHKNSEAMELREVTRTLKWIPRSTAAAETTKDRDEKESCLPRMTNIEVNSVNPFSSGMYAPCCVPASVITKENPSTQVKTLVEALRLMEDCWPNNRMRAERRSAWVLSKAG